MLSKVLTTAICLGLERQSVRYTTFCHSLYYFLSLGISDRRYLISNPATFPNSAMVVLTMKNGTGSYRCSGFLISPNTVATAGHCLFFQGSGLTQRGWAYDVRVYPGYTGSSAPFGSCGARRLYSVQGWLNNPPSAEYDYGVVKLDCNVGNSTGWLGYRWQSASLNGLPVHIQGYPPDKGWSQWGDDGSVVRTDANLIYSSGSITNGFEGAPIFDNGLYAVAIFQQTRRLPATCQGDVCTITSADYSWGTRITSSVFNNLQYWSNL